MAWQPNFRQTSLLKNALDASTGASPRRNLAEWSDKESLTALRTILSGCYRPGLRHGHRRDPDSLQCARPDVTHAPFDVGSRGRLYRNLGETERFH